MGSTPYGNANPTFIGKARPQNIKIIRDGNCRVRVLVAVS